MEEAVKQRIKEVLNIKGVNVNAFSNLNNKVQTTVNRQINGSSKITFDTINAFLHTYPDVSSEWLLRGHGDMFMHTEQQKDVYPARLSGAKGIPLVTAHAVAGLGNMDFAIREEDVKAYYVIPKFKYCNVDFMIEISGISMFPSYNSGDIVACTIIRNINVLQWNRCYIIATREQGLLCKRLRKSEKENCVFVVSDNKEYEPFDLPMDEITGIAMICGLIRLE